MVVEYTGCLKTNEIEILMTTKNIAHVELEENVA